MNTRPCAGSSSRAATFERMPSRRFECDTNARPSRDRRRCRDGGVRDRPATRGRRRKTSGAHRSRPALSGVGAACTAGRVAAASVVVMGELEHSAVAPRGPADRVSDGSCGRGHVIGQRHGGRAGAPSRSISPIPGAPRGSIRAEGGPAGGQRVGRAHHRVGQRPLEQPLSSGVERDCQMQGLLDVAGMSLEAIDRRRCRKPPATERHLAHAGTREHHPCELEHHHVGGTDRAEPTVTVHDQAIARPVHGPRRRRAAVSCRGAAAAAGRAPGLS